MRYTVIGNPHGLEAMLQRDKGEVISRELVREGKSWGDEITGTHWDYSIYKFTIEAKKFTKARWKSFGFKFEDE